MKKYNYFMPKLKEVKVTENSMSWENVAYNINSRKVVTTIPIRDFLRFLEKGKKVKKITLEFAD
jgi:hypothetical protein